MKIKISYTRPHPWRPRWPIPRHRLVSFGLGVTGAVSCLVGAVEYEAGDHRFRLLQLGGLMLLLAGHVIFFRTEWKRKQNQAPTPTGGGPRL